MKIMCLVVSAYRGTSIAEQRRIVTDLGMKLADDGQLLWHMPAPDNIDDMRRVEAALRGRVPYTKVTPEAERRHDAMKARLRA